MQDSFAHCETLVRSADKDRFIATLFAPAEHRGALYALYAFNAEVARVREVVREPVAGEIRLQWWRDVLAGEGRGDVAAHPIAAALQTTIARYALPVERLDALIDARRFDLYDEPMATLGDLESYARGASSGLIALAAQVLDGDRRGDIGLLAEHAGLAHAIIGLIRALPIHAARGQVFMPLDILRRHGADRQDVVSGQATPQLRAALGELRRSTRQHLAQAREAMTSVPLAVTPALLPVALVGPTLSRLERGDHDPFAPVEIAQWRRQWLIWRAARQPERIFS